MSGLLAGRQVGIFVAAEMKIVRLVGNILVAAVEAVLEDMAMSRILVDVAQEAQVGILSSLVGIDVYSHSAGDDSVEVNVVAGLPSPVDIDVSCHFAVGGTASWHSEAGDCRSALVAVVEAANEV